MPVFRELVAVPDGGEVSVQVRVRKQVIARGVDVAQYRQPANRPPAWPPSTPANVKRDRLFPADIAAVEHVGYMRGQRLACIMVSPARHDSISKDLFVATDLEISVAVANPTGPTLREIGPLQSALSGSVLNYTLSAPPHMLGPIAKPGSNSLTSSGGQVCWCTGTTWQAAAASAAACGADYLIIVTDSLAGSTFVDSLALRRASCNDFNVAIVRMSQIDATPDTSDTPVAIRSLIDSVYTAQTAVHMGDGRLGYVLLLGDAYDSSDSTLVPSFYGYANPQTRPKFDTLRASDAYYSFLDDDPYVDRFPDVLIGRLPVDDDATDWEISNLVRKIIRYEPLTAAAWGDSVLMISGSDPASFTFQTEGLAGFQAFFDSVLAYYSPPGKSIAQLHRLAYPSPNDTTQHRIFGNKVRASINRGKWLTAFFDHGNPFYWVGAFYARSYEFLADTGRPTVVFSIGSNTSQFDLTAKWARSVFGSCSVGLGCMVPPPSSLPCESPGYELFDACDVIAERLLVQPGGAVAVIGYSRSQEAADTQSDFTNLFRSLSEQNPSTLGELLVGARMYRLMSNVVLARNLMLLGDPAMNIRARSPAPADTFDLSVGAGDIQSSWASYILSDNAPVGVTVHNIWKTDVLGVGVELWNGDPEVFGSTLLESTVLDTVRAYGERVATFAVSGLQGNVELFVRVDPDDDIQERAEDNNMASRRFLALSYEADYPARLDFIPQRSITIGEVGSGSGKEVLIVGHGEASDYLQCFELADTTPAWSFSTGGSSSRIKNVPVVGHVYKSARSFVALESGNPSSVRIFSGETGVAVKTRSVGDSKNPSVLADGGSAKWLLTDLGADDAAMELVTLKYAISSPDSIYLRAFSPNGTALFSHPVEVGFTLPAATMAVADLDKNGSKEIVVLCALASGNAPAVGNELSVFTYNSGGLSRRWQRDVADPTAIERPAVVLIDADNDGGVEILCNGVYPGPTVSMYEADSTLAWTRSDCYAVGEYTVYFAAGDVDGAGDAEVVVADHERVRILSSTDGSPLDSQVMAGDPVSPPFLVDLDADGKLDIVVLFERKDPNKYFYPEQYVTYLSVLDENLNPLEPLRTFRTRSSNANTAAPAIDDIDGDGKYEMAYVSPDQYLHIFEIGSSAGDAAWPQRFGNAMQTGLNEQPVVGSNYANAVSLYQRTRMLGDVELDSIVAPSLYVGHGTEVRVDTSTADPFQLRAYGSVRIKGSATEPVVFRTEPPASGGATWGGLYVSDRFATSSHPDSILHLELSDALVGVSTHSPLDVNTMTVHGGDIGIDASSGAVVHLSNSSIEDCALYGAAVYDGAILNATGSVFDGNDTGLYLAREDAAWVSGTVRNCTFNSNTDGIWINDVGASSVVVHGCTLDDNTTTGIYVAGDGQVSITDNTITGSAVGVYSDGSYPWIRSRNMVQNNTVGIKCDNSSLAAVESCTVNQNYHDVLSVNEANPDLGRGSLSTGYNIFKPSTARYVFNLTSNTISAQYNYWPIDTTHCTPPASKFHGSVDRSHAQCYPPALGPLAWRLPAVQDVPSHFTLGQNYPNPFNPTTTVAYKVPKAGSRVEIRIYDVAGRLVTTLVDEQKVSGSYVATWDGRDRSGNPVASGVYFVRMRAGQFVATKKLVMLK